MALLELDRTDQRDLSIGVSVRDEGVGLNFFFWEKMIWVVFGGRRLD